MWSVSLLLFLVSRRTMEAAVGIGRDTLCTMPRMRGLLVIGVKVADVQRESPPEKELLVSPVIAIVDDDPIIVHLLERFLQKTGYTTRSWYVDKDVHQLISSAQPDLLILDLGLGSLSGWSVLDAVRLDPRTTHIPVIVCSGDSERLREKAARLIEMRCEIVEKPFDLRTLLSVVTKIVGQPPA